MGTSGYSYKDWIGQFYPKGTPQDRFLEYYSRHFDACEINFTYYRIPDARTLSRMVEKSDRKVEFVVKANRDMTHSDKAGDSEFRAFRDARKPMEEAGVFGGLLAQFPFSFHYNEAGRDRLKSIRDRFNGLPFVAEFRNVAWMTAETFDFLRRNDIGFCCVDEPRLKGLMPTVVAATSDVGYVRFHGRNAAKWWTHDRPEERYDYLYSADELSEWVPRIQEIDSNSKKTFVFMNNHFQAKAVSNAQMLLSMLQDKG